MRELIIWISILIIIFIIYTLWENNNPRLDKINIRLKLPNNLEKISILQISDLHNYGFGINQNKLTKLIKKDYDFVFLTGDLIDRRYPGYDNALDLLEYLNLYYNGKSIFVQGNHEKGSEIYNEFKEILNEYGVRILDNELFIPDDYPNIEIIGIEDPAEYYSVNERKKIDEYSILKINLERLSDSDNFKMVLSHRPEFFELYVDQNLDIVFSGHSHGGQVRIFNRGLLAPDQGFFAKYVGGIFKDKDAIMINSRGLGVNFPWAKRVFNRPHIIEVNLINIL